MELGSVEREIRRLRKSLRQIESLERLDRELTSDEAQKILKKTAVRSALAEKLSYLEESGAHHTSITESNSSLITDTSSIDLSGHTEEPRSPPAPSVGAARLGTSIAAGVDERPHKGEAAGHRLRADVPPREERSEQGGPMEAVSPDQLARSSKSTSPKQCGPKQPAINSPNQPPGPTSQPTGHTSSARQPTASSTNQNRAIRTKRSKWLNQRVVISHLEGHCDVVCSLDCNGEILMTGSRDTTVRVWCLQKMEELHSMGGHTAAVTCVKLLPRGYQPHFTKGEESPEWEESAIQHQLGLSGSLDSHVILWDVTAGKKITHIYTFSSVMSLEYSEGKVITGSDGGKVEVWSMETRQILQTIRGPSKGVTCLVVKDDRLFCGDVTGFVQIWNLGPPEQKGDVWTISQVEFPDASPFRARCIRCLCVHGNVVYWGDDGTNIKAMDISTGSMHTLANHTHTFGSTGGLAVCTDEDILVASSYDLDTGQASINMRSLIAGEHNMYLCSLQPTTPTVPYISALVATRHSNNIRLCTGGNELRVWDFVSAEVSPSRLSSGQSLITPSYALPDGGTAVVDTDSDAESDEDVCAGDEVNPLHTLHLKPLPRAKTPIPQVVKAESWFWWLCKCTVL